MKDTLSRINITTVLITYPRSLRSSDHNLIRSRASITNTTMKTRVSSSKTSSNRFGWKNLVVLTALIWVYCFSMLFKTVGSISVTPKKSQMNYSLFPATFKDVSMI